MADAPEITLDLVETLTANLRNLRAEVLTGHVDPMQLAVNMNVILMAEEWLSAHRSRQQEGA